MLLAVTTLCIAWKGGYQACAKWGALQARRYTQASTARAFANRAQTQASQARLQDLLNFNRWLEAEVAGNVPVADLYERRFRDEFRPRSMRGAPRATHSIRTSRSPHPCGCRSDHVLAGEVKAEKLEALGDRRFMEGKDATETADKYVFATVFLARSCCSSRACRCASSGCACGC